MSKGKSHPEIHAEAVPPLIHQWESVVYGVFSELDKAAPGAPPSPWIEGEEIAFRYLREWALYYAIQEMKAHSCALVVSLSHEIVAGVAFGSWLEWINAYIRYWRYKAKREFPEYEMQDAATFTATLAARLARDRDTIDHPALLEFQRRVKQEPEAVWRKFVRELHNPTVARARHPALDEWLILIQPIVNKYTYRWTNGDVVRVARKMFPNQVGDYPLGDSEEMRAHCRKLREYFWTDPRKPRKKSGPSPGSKARKDGLPPLADLALTIRK